jgi:hypothetical protein
MSTVRRLFDHPQNAQVVGTRVVQRCCDGNAPHWDSYRLRDTDDAWSSRDSDRNMPSYRVSDPLFVQDDTGASDNDQEVLEFDINGKVTGSNDKRRGQVLVEGPNSGYRPDFLTTAQWMDWQGVEFSADPRGTKLASGAYTTSLPNPPRWRRTRVRTDKMRWGKGVGGWGTYGWTFLWCQKCETGLEKAWSDTLKVLPVAARGIAMIVSYIPVYGTAVSFLINTSVSLAEGEPIDQAILDAIGATLPGQPTSGMAFRAGVSIARGERIDHVAIDALPIDKKVKDILKTADDIVYAIATGDNVTNVVLDNIQRRLPPEAAQGMGYARRIINGENVYEMVLSEAEQAIVQKVRAEADAILEAAKDKGQAAVRASHEQVEALKNQYVAEVGYQLAITKLPTELRDAVSVGLVVGAHKEPEYPRFGSVPEQNKEVNDTYAQKGERIIAGGARYNMRTLSAIRSGTSFTITIDDFDALNGVWVKKKKTYTITDGWRRGFTIAIGLCEGSSQRGPGQTAVYQTVAEAGGRDGFDAGQAIQYERTLHGDAGQLQQVATAYSTHANVLSALSGRPTITVPPPINYIQDKVALFTPEGQAAEAAARAKRLSEREAWVDHYLHSESPSGGTMAG